MSAIAIALVGRGINGLIPISECDSHPEASPFDRILALSSDSRKAGDVLAKRSIATGTLIASRILEIRGQKVLLDADLAALYSVATKDLNKAVARNPDRFPEDFMFRLTREEFDALRFHFGTSNRRGGRRYPPFVFTEQGVAMLSSVLRSRRAVAVNVQIMRTFVQLREMLSTHADLARKLDEMEKKYDAQFSVVFDAIRGLMFEKGKKRPPIGFLTEAKAIKRRGGSRT